MSGLLDLVAFALTFVLADVVFWNQNKPPPISPLTHPKVFDEMYAGLDERFADVPKQKRSHMKKA